MGVFCSEPRRFGAGALRIRCRGDVEGSRPAAARYGSSEREDVENNTCVQFDAATRTLVFPGSTTRRQREALR